ncbi:MAG: hypothetical protein M5U34_35785 [Chloroflexi bacterium]|nr:hypothetical protein [Chloroflexota bacterium]
MIPETLETTSQEWQELLTGELLMFTLLGKMLLQIPEKSWLQPILDEALFSDVPFAEQQVDVRQGLALFAQWSQQCDGTITPQGLTDLKADHTRLFTGLANIPVGPLGISFLYGGASRFSEANPRCARLVSTIWHDGSQRSIQRARKIISA